MDRHSLKPNPPPPGTGDPASIKVDHAGYVTATLPDGTTLKDKSVVAHLLFAILRKP